MAEGKRIFIMSGIYTLENFDKSKQRRPIWFPTDIEYS